MVEVGEDTFISILGMYGEIRLVEESRGVIFRSRGKDIAIYDKMKGRHFVESEDIRRLTEK